MGLKMVATILFKIFLIHIVFISCVCHAKPKKGGGAPPAAGGGMKKPASVPETCTCETFKNLCLSPDEGLDIRIANHDYKELTCNPFEYHFCDIPKLTCSYRRIRGENDLLGKHPWHVSIYDKSVPPKFVGSGVLIKKQYVLTIAHKVIPHEKSGVKLRLGEFDRALPCNNLEFKSSQIVIHSEYNAAKNHINDIALIKLDKEVDIDSYPHVNTACLASTMPAEGTYCVVAGWGTDIFVPPEVGGPNSFSDRLKEIFVPIVSHARCEAELKKTRLKHAFKLDKTSFVCAGGEIGHDACSGDGGAPLMCPNAEGVLQVAGLVVGGIGCNSKVPGLYTNVPEFKSWIEDSIFETIDD